MEKEIMIMTRKRELRMECTSKTWTYLNDDSFNYLATNDPEKGFGFDICIECHDLALFPTAAHMRAAEEHLGMLDIMWKERWEAAWNPRQEKRQRAL